MKHFSPRWTSHILFCTLLIFGMQMTALATTRNVKTGCGATGNGSTDDTAAIKTCISQLVSGDTLEFPAGTYIVTAELDINVTGITIDGSNNTATIRNTASSARGIQIGQHGMGNTNGALGTPVALSATANELSTSFTTVSSLGASAGSYVYLQQGGQDSSQGSGNTGCDTSGCRGEVLKVASVSGNTITVTTELHDTFNPSVNAATAQLISGMLSGVTIQNITFDGGGGENSGVTYGLMVNDVADSTLSNVTVKNVQGSAILPSVDFNLALNNVVVRGAGSEGCGAAVQLYLQGNPSANSVSISNLNPGAPNTGCEGDGSFGFELSGGAGGTFTGLTIDAAGTGGGRPMKLTASRYNTFNNLTVENGCCAFNGLSLEYYSSHNTFNSCVVQNNAAGNGSGGAGINSFGNFNQYNTFNDCNVTGNGNVQILVNNFDALRLGQDSNLVVNGTTVAGPGVGIIVNASDACINGNTFTAASGLSTGISVMNNTNIGSDNVLNGYTSNLTSGTCQSGSQAPAPPTGLTAVVQ